ncbi:2-polyprenyl-3-methyl-6-methoxy-1,4-benzoquinone monooxygenase [Marinicella sp. W31]|uniref:2-polyprenyl-3-methyl-6-methoxy-1,4-benzoquinone monooxygenase n=1 Tax=Marinicella sp. W31 TaxID=3023713 RepID=UPI003756DA55
MRHSNSSLGEKFCLELDRMLNVVANKPNGDSASIPGHDTTETHLTESEKKHLAGLMRINHTGEVCAQALYFGQALLARDADTKKQLLHAAQEEQEHLYWCHQRLQDLNERPSYLNPIWYVSSFALGLGAAAFGDPVSYGFVMETEKQVESHLQEHIEQLNVADHKSRAILEQMQADEIRHGQAAKDAGGVELPQPIKWTMTLMSNIMKKLAYRI